MSNRLIQQYRCFKDMKTLGVSLDLRRRPIPQNFDMYTFNPLQFQKVYANPFPVNSSYQHCRGSTPITRGYTCGLWTTFHALTVHTYIDTIKDDFVDPMKPLKAIQVMSNRSKSDCMMTTPIIERPIQSWNQSGQFFRAGSRPSSVASTVVIISWRWPPASSLWLSEG